MNIWDRTGTLAPNNYIGLSSETKETSNIVNGSTFYEVDTKKTFVCYEGVWYEA